MLLRDEAAALGLSSRPIQFSGAENRPQFPRDHRARAVSAAAEMSVADLEPILGGSAREIFFDSIDAIWHHWPVGAPSFLAGQDEGTDVINSHGRFVWYELITTDVEAATAFYTHVMGWGAWDASVPGKPYILFGDGKASISGLMHLPDDARQMGAKPSWIGYVGVNDVDATAARIGRLGGAVHVPPTDVSDISRFSIFTDPQTARLALFKWLRPGQERPAEPDAPGRVGWHELLAADWEKAWAFYGDLFGWQKEDADIGEMGTYQLFSAGGQMIGGMLTKPPTIPVPFWLYYFNVGDIDATAQRVKAGGGEILDGPLEVPGGSWIVRCADPQGAIFALEGTRRSSPVGYFERVASRDSSAAPGRRRSW